KRCPQCHSPVAERLPHAVMYDCGFSFFNDGQPVTDDYPAECQRRRIKRLEKQLADARAEAEGWRQKYEELKAGLEELIRHVRLVLPEVRIAQAPVSRTGDHSRRRPAGRIGR